MNYVKAKKSGLMGVCRSVAVGSVLMACLPLAQAASEQSSSVVYEDVGFISTNYLSSANAFVNNGPGIQSMVTKVDIDKAGSYKLTLTDFNLNESINNLGAWFGTATSSYAKLLSPGTIEFNATPGSYFVGLFGEHSDSTGLLPLGTTDFALSQGNGLNLGLYGLQISQIAPSAVPLPAPFVLLASALVALAGFGRGGRRLKSN